MLPIQPRPVRTVISTRLPEERVNTVKCNPLSNTPLQFPGSYDAKGLGQGFSRFVIDGVRHNEAAGNPGPEPHASAAGACIMCIHPRKAAAV